MDPIETQKFNDDLLLTESDRWLAGERFPELAHVLNFPDLRDMFVRYEAEANRAKTSQQRAGFVGIFLGVLALMGVPIALSETLSAPWTGVVGGISALLGVAGMVIGVKRALTGEPKQQWLCSRLMTERLRQFQFQILVCRMPQVLASTVDSVARERFLSDREAWFTEFRLTYEGHLEAKLRAALDDDAENSFLLHHSFESRHPVVVSDRALLQLFSAYRLLRLEHQLQYADYKLRPDERILSDSCVRQRATLRNVSLVLIVLVLVAHPILALSVLSDSVTGLIHLLIICLLIGVLAVRAIEEGLQPGREVERYAGYRSSMLSLLKRFDHAPSPEERIRLMLETERTVYQEMRGFLRTSQEARYLL
jgi:hypothetical protein